MRCFMVTFDSEQAANKICFTQTVVELLLPVFDKVRVLDFWDGE
ncbi:MAG: hypothetical protein AB8G99_06440 [Planctomycetaceae bacterium]